MKKWNWGAFGMVMLICCIGVLGNKSVTNFIDGVILVSIVGLPIGLMWAWLSRD